MTGNLRGMKDSLFHSQRGELVKVLGENKRAHNLHVLVSHHFL